MSEAPDSATLYAAGHMGGGSQSQEPAGGKSLDGLFDSIQQKGMAGFNKEVVKGGNVNIIEAIGSSPLTTAVAGKPNAFEGLQEANLSPQFSGSVMTPPAINQGSVVGLHSKEQGH